MSHIPGYKTADLVYGSWDERYQISWKGKKTKKESWLCVFGGIQDGLGGDITELAPGTTKGR